MTIELTVFDLLLAAVLPGMVLSLFYMLKGTRNYTGKGRIVNNPYPNIVFLYAARRVGAILQESVNSVVTSCREIGLTDYRVVSVVTQGGSLNDSELLVVPEDYVCQSQFKARQLNYALGFLPDTKKAWILHLDEDAKVTFQTIISILRYIKNGGAPVANGPTLFPYNGNILTFFVEAQRAWTYYWCKFQMETGAVYWMNGSNMLVRSDIEQRVRWDFTNCKYSEDTRFVYEVTKMYGREAFGWHGGLTLERPPASISSAVRQRMRWYWGGMLQLRHMPWVRLGRRLYSSFAWLCGFFLTALIPVGLILNVAFSIDVFTQSILIVGGVSISGLLWIFRYQFGLLGNLRVSPLSVLRKVALHIILVPAAFFVEFVCTVPTILALVRPPRTFEITRKE